jgi:hypothetical protein
MELQAALVDLGHKHSFGLLLKEAWNSEQAAMVTKAYTELFHILYQEPRTRVEWQRKFTDIFGADRMINISMRIAK